jgi:hypothetical protein
LGWGTGVIVAVAVAVADGASVGRGVLGGGAGFAVATAGN